MLTYSFSIGNCKFYLFSFEFFIRNINPISESVINGINIFGSEK